MANFKMRANTCTYFKNAGPLASSAQNIDILSRSNRSGVNVLKFIASQMYTWLRMHIGCA